MNLLTRLFASTVAAAVAIVLTGCGNDGDQTNTSTGTRDITKTEVENGGKKWPFIPSEVTLTCKDQAVTASFGGKVYALNGTAKARHAGDDVTELWAQDPNTPGLRVNIGDVIEMGLALCE